MSGASVIRPLVVILHAPADGAWAAHVAGWLTDLASAATERDDAIEIVVGSDAQVRAADATCAVYLATADAKADDDLQTAGARAVDADAAVFPVWRPADGTAHDLLPDRLSLLNATRWSGDVTGLGIHLLAAAGVAESERRLFLSYRRTDASPLAEQLHTALQQAGYDVFLDRFAVPPGVDFQERLVQDLADKAFVVILESPNFVGNHWTELEVSYAVTHRLGMLAVATPELPDDRLVPAIAEPFRHRLDADDLRSGELTPAAMTAIIDRIERDHARALRRRREQLLGSLRQKLDSDGCTARTAGEWAVVAERAGHRPSVFLVTPRRPRPHDLYELHQTRERVLEEHGEPLDAAVVHEIAHIPKADADLLRWIGEPREFQAVMWDSCALREEDAS